MILAQYSNINFGFHDKPIVRDFSLMLQDKCRIGLIGANGSGKTTLLRLLCGELKPDEGSVVLGKNVRIGFLRQNPDVPRNTTVRQILLKPFEHLLRMEQELEQLSVAMGDEQSGTLFDQYDRIQEQYSRAGGYVFRSRIDQVMGGLGFSSEDSGRLLESFSGGEQARIMLAKLLLEGPELMLLDEPTNHLDLHAVEFLERFLANFNGGVMLISHDRYFLDRVTGTIVELAGLKCEVFPGNFTAYKIEKAQRDAIRHKHYVLQQKHIAKLEDFIRRNMAAQKTKQAQSRLKELERIDRLQDVHGPGNAMRLHFRMDRTSGQIVFRTHDLGKSFDGRVLFGNSGLTLHRNDRIGLIGPNGSGKTTFLRILTGQETPDQGSVEWGYHVRYAIFNQHLHDLNDSASIMDEVWQEQPGMTVQEVRDHLGRFLFSGDEVFKLIGMLSGGERARVALAKLFLKDANLLFLDEPTNHLDLDARESLESALMEYTGTIVMVTHDRYLLDRVANRIWFLENQRIEESLGNYSDYVIYRDRSGPPVAEPEIPTAEDSESRQKKNRREQRLARMEVRKKTGKSAAFYEKEISRLEADLQSVKTQMLDPGIADQWMALGELAQKEAVLQAELRNAMEAWETAAEAESELSG